MITPEAFKRQRQERIDRELAPLLQHVEQQIVNGEWGGGYCTVPLSRHVAFDVRQALLERLRLAGWLVEIQDDLREQNQWLSIRLPREVEP